MADNATILSHSQLFHGMDLGHLKELIKRGKISKTAAGEALVREGDTVAGLYVILEGHVRVVKAGQSTLTQIGRGGFFGEISIFGMAIGATASIVAPEGCTSLVLTRSELGTWFKQFPALETVFLRHLARELCNRLYSTTDKLVQVR